MRELELLKGNLGKLKGDDDRFQVVLMGWSYGGDKAIDVANSMARLLQTDDRFKDLNGRVTLNLVTVDAIGRGRVNNDTGFYSGRNPSTNKLSVGARQILGTWRNYFQGIDSGWDVPDSNVDLPRLRGSRHFPGSEDSSLDGFFPGKAKDPLNGVHVGMLDDDNMQLVDFILDELLPDGSNS